MIIKIIRDTLAFISKNGYETNHNKFLKETAVFLAEQLKVSYVLIDKFSIETPTITETIVFYGKGKFLSNITYELENTPCQNVINKKLCTYPANTKNLFIKDHFLTKKNIESYIGIPLWSSTKEPIGLMAIMDDKPKSVKEIEEITTIFEIIAIKVERVLESILFENTLNLKITALKIANKAAEENEEKFESLTNLTLEGILIHDNFDVIDVNTSMIEMFGYKRRELLGKNSIELLFPKKHHQLILRSKAKNCTLPLEIEGIKKGGFVFPVIVEPRYFNGAIKAMAIRDISERKKTEIENKKLSVAIEQSANTIVITDVCGNIEYTNPKFTEITGYTAEEALGKNPRILNSGKHPKAYFEQMWQIISSGKIWKGEFQNKAKNGKLFWEKVTVSPIKNDFGEIINYLAIKEDISKNKEDGESLRKSEEKYRHLFFNNPQPMWIYDIETLAFLEINNAAIRHYGYTRDEFLTMTLKDIRSKEDIETLLKNIELTQQLIYKPASEWKHIKKNGEVIHVDIVSHAILFNGVKARNVLINDITASKNAKKALIEANREIEKSEKKFRELFEKSGDAILIIKNGVFIDCNQATLKILGYKKYEDILNLHPSKLSPEFQPDGLNSSEKAEKLINITLKNGTHRFEWWHIKSDGEIFPLEVLLTTIENELDNEVIHCVWRDITIRKKSEEEQIVQFLALENLSNELSEKNGLLVESKDRFENLFEKSPVSLWEEDFTVVKKMLIKKKKEVDDLKTYLDNHHDFVKECASKIEILKVNEITLKLFGVKDINELKINLQKTDTATSYEVLKKELIAIASNKNEFIEESEFTSRNGNVIKAIIKSSIIEGSNKAIISIIDITKLKNYEEKLIEAKEKAEESGRLKTKFIQNMSHEIRTPMNGILGFTDLLDNPMLTEEKRKRFIEVIKNSTNQLLHVIDDIMEISVLETKQIKAVENPVCLNDLLRELFIIFNIKANKNKTSLILTNGLSDLKSTILIDKNKLNKVMNNLLENALKFTDKGIVEFGYQLKNKQLEIFVKDTGIGIKQEAHELIFDRFSQAEKDMSKIAGGLGLGLSIAKENAELLGGKIAVKSILGEGAAFFVTLPYKPVDLVFEIGKEKEKATKNKRKYTILVVEDEDINFMVLEILLLDKIKLPCNIIHAKDGIEAVELCKNNQDIEFVLMDIKMPKMDGHEATRLIKQIRPNLPIIAQTAYSTSEEREKAFLAGCDDFISKPISKESLVNALNNYLLEEKTLVVK
ncbi:MAG: PAS domain S-box protein [Lutibacter sp.]